MNKNYLKLEYKTLLFFLVNSFFINVGYSILTRNSYTDSIIDIIIGSVFILCYLAIILGIRNYYKKDLITIINSYKYLKYPLYVILIIILSISTLYSLTTLTSFINYYILKEVNLLTISISLIMVTIYLVSKDLPTISRVSQICFYIYIIILIIGFIGLINYIDLSNLKPFLTTSIKEHYHSSFIFYNYSILPLFLVLFFNDNNYDKKSNILFFIFTAISLLIIFLQLILIISVLGINLTNLYEYPDIMIYKKISFLNIFERIEVFLAFNQVLNGLFIITVNMYLIKKIILNFLKKKKEKVILSLLSFVLIFLSNTISISKNNYLIINDILIFITLIILIRSIFTIITKRS